MQDHEIQAWLGAQWGEDQTAELVRRIKDSGSADEADWSAICQQHDGTLEVIDLSDVRARVRSAVRASVWAGMSEAEAARTFGVTRMTVRSWLGK